jgi:hypothetical protein
VEPNLPDTDFVVVYRTDNRLDASMMEDALLRAGVDARTQGVLAVTGELELVVAAADEDVARACIAELEPSAPAARDGEPNALAGKSARVAWGVALVPGFGHIYAGASIRGVVLLLGLLSSVYWARVDHLIAAAPLLLFVVDALGATTLIAGRTSRLWTALAFTAPLWVAAPAVLLQAAPSVYIGSSGRDICASLERCEEPWAGCETSIAQQIGFSVGVRRKTRECAALFSEQQCDVLVPTVARDDAQRPGVDACDQLFNGTAHFEEERAGFQGVRPPQGWGM